MEPFLPFFVDPFKRERVTYFVRLLQILGACIKLIDQRMEKDGEGSEVGQ